MLRNSEAVYFGLCWPHIQRHDGIIKWMHIV